MIRNFIISIIVGAIIVWLLLSKIDPREIPRAISNIPLQNAVFAFLLYTTSVFFKAFRFKIILRTGISLKRIFRIVSLYMFFSNILPMRAGELSYIYLLKKDAKTAGTKSLASLIIGGIADVAVTLIAMSIVAWHLKDVLAERSMGLFIYSSIEEWVHGSIISAMLIAGIILLVLAIIGFILIKYGRKYFLAIKTKLIEVVHELANVTIDIRLAAIIVLSVLIISFRFGTQWYLIRSMGIPIGIWEFTFALLFGVLFSLVPIHGPAGFGTVEAPWVLALVYLNVPKKDAITSGFGLHIVVMLFCVILGIYGATAIFLAKKKDLSCRV